MKISNHYAVHFKITIFYVNYISLKIKNKDRYITQKKVNNLIKSPSLFYFHTHEVTFIKSSVSFLNSNTQEIYKNNKDVCFLKIE